MSMAAEVKQIISEIETTGGVVTAQIVVERAKNVEKFPSLHAHLWETPEADLAQEARIGRAHRLLITIKVTIPETGESTRMMVHTRGMTGYSSLEAVAKQPDVAKLKLQQLVADIARARARLNGFRYALPDELADEIDEALATAETRASQAPSRQQAPTPAVPAMYGGAPVE